MNVTVNSPSRVVFQVVKSHLQLGAPVLESTGPDTEDKMSQGNEEEAPEEGQSQERKRYHLGHTLSRSGAWSSAGSTAEVRLSEGSDTWLGWRNGEASRSL